MIYASYYVLVVFQRSHKMLYPVPCTLLYTWNSSAVGANFFFLKAWTIHHIIAIHLEIHRPRLNKTLHFQPRPRPKCIQFVIIPDCDSPLSSLHCLQVEIRAWWWFSQHVCWIELDDVFVISRPESELQLPYKSVGAGRICADATFYM